MEFGCFSLNIQWADCFSSGTQGGSDEDPAGFDSRSLLTLPEPKAPIETAQAPGRASTKEEEEMERGVCCLWILCRRRWRRRW